MVTILFWNIHKAGPVLPHLACLAARHAVDLFLLAECPRDIAPALAALGPAYREVDNGGAKVRALTRLEPPHLTHRYSLPTGDFALWSLQAPKFGGAILLGGVHLPSKFGGMTSATQAEVAREVIGALTLEEDLAGHRNAAIIGDFNMHPYDEGMTSVTGFHALATRSLAERPDRLYRGMLRRRFYNPMWGLFGDRTPGPAGTYRWESSLPHNTHWAMLDQVLLRPPLIGCIPVAALGCTRRAGCQPAFSCGVAGWQPALREQPASRGPRNYGYAPPLIPCLADLGILEEDGTHTLVDGEGFPDAENFSDHLPVVFRLDV